VHGFRTTLVLPGVLILCALSACRPPGSGAPPSIVRPSSETPAIAPSPADASSQEPTPTVDSSATPASSPPVNPAADPDDASPAITEASAARIEIIASGAPSLRRASGPAFVHVGASAGVTHRHHKGVFDPKLGNVMPWVASIGAAAAVSDYDGDGDIDLYVTSSRRGTFNALYRNDGPWRFTEVARVAGVARVNDRSSVSMDAAFADLDNDGDDDLYIAKWGKNQLFRNDGDGKFIDVSEAARADHRGNATCVLPFDYDGDGLLDLLVCNYFPPVDLTALETVRVLPDSLETARNGGANVLLHNLGGLEFEDVAHELRLDDTGWSLDAGISDIDNDGDVDLFVVNAFGQDRLFLNDGGRFVDFTATAIGPDALTGMSVDFGDVNDDGFTDAYVTGITTEEFLRDGNSLWLNDRDATFTNVARPTGTFDGGWGWCGRLFDFDHDGDLDIVAVNGFASAGKLSYWEDLARTTVDPAFDPADPTQWTKMDSRSLSGHERTRLFRNGGHGSFDEIAAVAGVGETRDGRGVALADFDGDGDLDLYVAHQNAVGSLFRNDAADGASWLALSLVGTRSNRNAIGARVQVAARRSSGDEVRVVREVTGCNGHASQSSYRLHFGLADATRVERMTVFWPSGIVSEFDGLEVRAHYRVTESGEPQPPAERARSLAFERERASPARLLELEARLRLTPRNAILANEYRHRCVDRGAFDRSIEFFRELIATRGSMSALHLQLALALIDKIPSQTGDVLAQGSTAKLSLVELGIVEERQPRSYAVRYLTGMNHLYWPAALKHFDDAVQHFEACIEIQRERESRGRAKVDHYAEIWLALGDAHVKAKSFELAREAWAEGRKRFSDDARFAARMGMPDAELTATVKRERGLKERIDTRLEMLVDEHGLGVKEARLVEVPGDRQTLNAYRLEAFELDATERVERFLKILSEDHPEEPELRLATALVEADRFVGVGADVVGSADARRKMVAELGVYSAKRATEWLPHFLGGLAIFHDEVRRASGAASADAGNASNGTSDLVERLQRAMELAAGADGEPRAPYPALILGDALAWRGEVERARVVWEAAREAFPSDRELAVRAACPDDGLRTLVAADRASRLGLPIDLEVFVEREAALERQEAALRREPTRARCGQFRRDVLAGDEADRAVRLFEKLVDERPRSAMLRVELALALVDRIPDRRLGSVRKGLLSSRALELIAPVIEAFPGNWGLHYLRGTIHLHRLPKLGHGSYAIDAFLRCLTIQKGLDPHHALAYRSIGDAYVKQHQFATGRMRYWKKGQKLFPNDRGLKERIDLTAHMVDAYVDERCSWSAKVDTWLLSDLVGDLDDLPQVPERPSAAKSTTESK